MSSYLVVTNSKDNKAAHLGSDKHEKVYRQLAVSNDKAEALGYDKFYDKFAHDYTEPPAVKRGHRYGYLAVINNEAEVSGQNKEDGNYLESLVVKQKPLYRQLAVGNNKAEALDYAKEYDGLDNG